MENESKTTTLLPLKDANTGKYLKAIQLQELLITISSTLLLTMRTQGLQHSRKHLNLIAAALPALQPLCDDETVKTLPISYPAMYRNISWTLDKITDFIQTGQQEKAEDLTEFQLIPFLQEWKEDTYFWLLIYPDREKMKKYYESDFIDNHKNTYQNRGEKFLVSIFIPVYNKLEYTKKCLESLYRHTDFEKYPCELILLNDGSSDGTEEYFSSLGVRKVITLKENVKAMIFTLMYQVCEGKYAAFINNDTILTEHWLDNLLTCIQSDPQIISAVPSTPNTSNRQSMSEVFTPENAEKTAEQHNRSDPGLWEERCRLMPVIALYDIDKVNTIGFADRYFYTLEFWDDDFSLRARRAGYKQILCRDTWCWHFGSVSGREDQIKHRTLQAGRALFIRKHGVDAWGNNFCYDPYLMDRLEPTFSSPPSEISILGIDPGFGADILQLRTGLKKHGKTASVFLLSRDPAFKSDLSSCCSQTALSPSPLELHRHIPEENYHYISIGQELSTYPDFAELLAECAGHLEKGGYLFFYVSNPYSFRLKNEMLEERMLNGRRSMTLIPITELASMLTQLGLQTQIRGIFGTNLPAELKINMSEHLDRYFVLCSKAKP
ncbi:glycosyltransferase [Lachnospiraceae bacterium 54-53]